MSAAVIITYEKVGFIFSDSALYDTEGGSLSYASKIYPLPLHRAAFGGRDGHALKLALLATIETTAPRGESFDGLVARLVEVVDSAMVQIAMNIRGTETIKAEFFFVGWSDKQGCIKSYVLHAEDGPDGLHYNIAEMGRGLIMGPNLNGTDHAIDFARFGSVEADAAPALAALVMERQRQFALSNHPGHHVDGAMTMARITKNCVEMAAVHELGTVSV